MACFGYSAYVLVNFRILPECRSECSQSLEWKDHICSITSHMFNFHILCCPLLIVVPSVYFTGILNSQIPVCLQSTATELHVQTQLLTTPTNPIPISDCLFGLSRCNYLCDIANIKLSMKVRSSICWSWHTFLHLPDPAERLLGSDNQLPYQQATGKSPQAPGSGRFLWKI